MENNDQSNYEIGVLREEIASINELVDKFRKENIDVQSNVPDPKDPKHYFNLLNKVKLINNELKVFKEKITPIFETLAIYPNFPKTGGPIKENNAREKYNLLTIQTFLTQDDNMVTEMISGYDDQFENTQETLKKLQEYRKSHNKLIDKILH